MEYSINFNDAKTAKLIMYRDGVNMCIEVCDFKSDTPLQFATVLNWEEVKKFDDIITDIKYEIEREDKRDN